MATRNNFTRNFVLVSALIFLVAIGFSNVSAGPVNSSEAFDFNGTIYFPNGSVASGVNVTVSLYDNNNGTTTSLSVAKRIFTEMTNVNGFFSFTEERNISGSRDQLWLIEFISNSSAPIGYNNTFIGPRFSPMTIARVIFELSNKSIYLQQAIHFNITSMFNATGHNHEFNFTVIDNALGIRAYNNMTFTDKQVKFGGHSPIDTNVTNFTLPRNRNSSLGKGYTIIVWRASPISFGEAAAIDMVNRTGPVAFYFPINDSYNHNMTVNLNLNASLNLYAFQGNLTSTVNTSALNFTGTQRYVHLAHNGNITLADFGFDNYTGHDTQYGGADGIFVDYASSSGNFNVTVPGYANDTGTTSIGLNQSYIFAAFANESALTTAATPFYFGAFVNLSTAREGSPTYLPNLQMRRLGGIQYFSDINATKVLFNPVNDTNITLGEIFDWQVEVSYPTVYNGVSNTIHIVWTGTSNSSGYFAFPLLTDFGAKVRIYHSAYSPQEFEINPAEILASADASVNKGMINLSVKEYIADDPDGSGFTSMTMDIYNTTAACGNATLTTSCPVAMRFGRFTTQATTKILNFQVINATLRQTFQSVEFIFKEVDLSSTGYPTAFVDTAPAKVRLGSYYIYSWKVGSSTPRSIYRSAEVGFPYEDTEINDQTPITVNITRLYNTKWNIIWDPTVNGTNPSIGVSGLADVNNTLLTGNVLCSTINPTLDCFVNTSKNIVYVKFPHFTGYMVNINGTAIPSTSTTTSTGGSGGGGGGAAGGSGAVSGSLYWSAITGGQETTFLSSEPRIPITKIVFIPVEDLVKTRLTVSTFDANRPAEVSVDAPGNLYDYMEITVSAEEGTFALEESAKINFQVEEQWIDDNNLDANTIALYRWDTEISNWQRLPTTRLNEDDNFVYFQALTEGFSFFAVSAGGELPLPGPTVEEGGIRGPSDIIVPESLQKPSNIILILIIVVLVIFIFYELQKPRNKRLSKERRSAKRRTQE